MHPQGPVLIIEQLSRNDNLDLRDYLSSEVVVAKRPVELPSGRLGESSTVDTIIAITPSVLIAVSAWLATRGKDVDVKFSVKAPGFHTDFTLNATSAQELPQQVSAQGIIVPPD